MVEYRSAGEGGGRHFHLPERIGSLPAPFPGLDPIPRAAGRVKTKVEPSPTGGWPVIPGGTWADG